MFGRLLVGLVKGAIVGAGLGFAAEKLALHELVGTSLAAWLTYALVGFVVGLLVGRPVWSHLLDRSSTVVTSILKGVFGVLLAVGLYALYRKLVVDVPVTMMGETRAISQWPLLFGGMVGALLGAWFEADDPPVSRKKQLPAGATTPSRE